MVRRTFVWAAIGSFFLDQVTKVLAYGLLSERVPHRVIGDLLRLSLTTNERGLFGLNYGPKFIYFILPLIGVGLVVYFALKNRSRWYALAYGMILGGAVGNLVDRLRVGSVIDFIDVGLSTWRWYTFNGADAFVICGIILLLACELFGRRRQQATPEPAGEPGEGVGERDEAGIPG